MNFRCDIEGPKNEPKRRLCIVQDSPTAVSETFFRAQAERLPAETTVIYGFPPSTEAGPVQSQARPRRAIRKASRLLLRRNVDWVVTSAYLHAFRKHKAEAVLAQYGPTGVEIREACALAGVPLIVHFHGYDASNRDLLRRYENAYQSLFETAAAVVAVSRPMMDRLCSLGASREKLHYNPYGVDCSRFSGGTPAESAPLFVAVGRFVEKKAPHLTLLAFAQVHRACPEARIRLIGDGPLLNTCRDLAQALGIEDAVCFLGAQHHDVVRKELRSARCFVQHSVEAWNGDCEGTPVGILEACATGLPVVSTRHAGIPEVVQEGKTGYLVEERDVSAMVRYMIELTTNPQLAGEMGRAAWDRIRSAYSMDQSIKGLWSIIESCITRRNGTPRAPVETPRYRGLDH